MKGTRGIRIGAAGLALLASACATQHPPSPQSPQSPPPPSPQSPAGSGGQAQAGAATAGAAPGREGQAKGGAPAGQSAPAAGGASVPGRPPGAMTSAEHQAVLDRKLEESLGEFDQRLAREQAELDQIDRSTQAATANRQPPPGSGGLGQGGAGGYVAPGSAGTSAGDENMAEGVGGGGRGNQAEIAARTPEDIPSGADDDIVARQLREAAVNEDDPELREKLWDEYRRYKASQ